MYVERAYFGLPWTAVWHQWIEERAESNTHSDTTVSFDLLLTNVVFFKLFAHIINAGYNVRRSLRSWHILERCIPGLTRDELAKRVIHVHSIPDPFFRESSSGSKQRMCIKKRNRLLKKSNQVPANGIQSLIRCSWRDPSHLLAMCQS